MRVITNYVTRSKRQPLVDFLTRIEQKTFIPSKTKKEKTEIKVEDITAKDSSSE